MTYEVEVRASPSEAGWKEVKCFLDENAENIGEFRYWTCLFRDPTYLRLRKTQGKDNVVITIKYGEGTARVETEQHIPLDDLKDYLLTLKVKGYTQCAFIRSISHAYKYKDVRVDVNHIDNLGYKVEVELMVEDEKRVEESKQKVREVLEELGLTELSQDDYQLMLDEMYEKSMTKIDDVSKKILS